MTTTQYQVMVRSGSTDLFLASVLGIDDCIAEGRTRVEAIAKVKAALVERLARGEIVSIDIAVENGSMSAANVWREEAGRFRDDATFDAFITEVQSHRHNFDSE